MRKMLLIIFLFSLISGFLSMQPAHAQLFSENFDSYSNGSQMHGQGGWKGWNNNPPLEPVTNIIPWLPNSVILPYLTCYEFSGLIRVLTLIAWQYIPSNFNRKAFILMNSIMTDHIIGQQFKLNIFRPVTSDNVEHYL
jgi:hypothetical protein